LDIRDFMMLYFIAGADDGGKKAVMPNLKELLVDNIAVLEIS